MLHYNPQHVSSSTMFIFRRKNCIITASGTVTLRKRPYIMPVESGLSPLLTGIMYGFGFLPSSRFMKTTTFPKCNQIFKIWCYKQIETIDKFQ